MAIRPAPPADNQPQVEQVQQTTEQWGSVSPHKLAKIRLCSKEGVSLGGVVVCAVLTDGEFTTESSYQSPFEASNPETKLPNLMGMIQSGQFITSITGIAGKAAGSVGSAAITAAQALSEASGLAGVLKNIGSGIASLEGKTNLTKINSTLIFVSTASVKISCSLFFMALKDAKVEVEIPFSQLQQWSLPAELSKQGLLESVVGNGLLDGLFPSSVLPYVSLTYGGKTYAPFLLENVAAPISGPMDQHGNRLNLSTTLSLASRQAWDAGDLKTLYGRSAS